MTEASKHRPTKAYVLDAMLASEESVYVVLDSRAPGVVVPDGLRNRPQVMLELGLNMAVPIRDLRATDEGWSATLSFGTGFIKCIVPWGAVYSIFNPRNSMGMLWREDVPKELFVAAEGVQGPIVNAEVRETRKTLPPGWRVIDGGRKDEDSEPEDSGAA